MKKLLLISIVLFSFVAVNAQTGFFAPLPKLHERDKINFNPIVSSTDSVFFGIRPIVSVVAYSVPAGNLQAGAGISLSRLDYKFATQKYYVNYSINGIGFAGSTITPTSASAVVSAGILLGVLNNNIMVGPAYTFTQGTKQNWQIMASVGLNFNN